MLRAVAFPLLAQLLSMLMWPFDHAANRPAVSENGKYVFRMFFNGCWRQVVIDDRLPASAGHRALFVVDRRNPQLLWPALIEKAYLKVRGGYNFPGSNSATDLHVLTGWIPEQIFLQTSVELPPSFHVCASDGRLRSCVCACVCTRANTGRWSTQ